MRSAYLQALLFGFRANFPVTVLVGRQPKRQSLFKTLGAHLLRLHPDRLQHLHHIIAVYPLRTGRLLADPRFAVEQLDRMLAVIARQSAKLVQYFRFPSATSS